MDIGMLWFDNDRKSSIPSKVERAARYYQKKYGVNPNLCYVHPKTVKGEKKRTKRGIEGKPIKIGKVLVLKNEKVLPDHFWIGVSSSEDPVS
jgi:hypothetical protein